MSCLVPCLPCMRIPRSHMNAAGQIAQEGMAWLCALLHFSIGMTQIFLRMQPCDAYRCFSRMPLRQCLCESRMKPVILLHTECHGPFMRFTRTTEHARLLADFRISTCTYKYQATDCTHLHRPVLPRNLCPSRVLLGGKLPLLLQPILISYLLPAQHGLL